jgi:hypothetical protein
MLATNHSRQGENYVPRSLPFCRVSGPAGFLRQISLLGVLLNGVIGRCREEVTRYAPWRPVDAIGVDYFARCER